MLARKSNECFHLDKVERDREPEYRGAEGLPHAGSRHGARLPAAAAQDRGDPRLAAQPGGAAGQGEAAPPRDDEHQRLLEPETVLRLPQQCC